MKLDNIYLRGKQAYKELRSLDKHQVLLEQDKKDLEAL